MTFPIRCRFAFLSDARLRSNTLVCLLSCRQSDQSTELCRGTIGNLNDKLQSSYHAVFRSCFFQKLGVRNYFTRSFRSGPHIHDGASQQYSVIQNRIGTCSPTSTRSSPPNSGWSNWNWDRTEFVLRLAGTRTTTNLKHTFELCKVIARDQFFIDHLWHMRTSFAVTLYMSSPFACRDFQWLR